MGEKESPSQFWCGSKDSRSSEKFRNSRKLKKLLEFKRKMLVHTGELKETKKNLFFF